WSFMRAMEEPSVFLAGFGETPETWNDDALAATFDRLLGVRGAVTKALEGAVVKQGSEARVTLGATGELGQLLAERVAELPALFVVAEVVLGDGGTGSPLVPGLRVRIERAPGGRCERCWRTLPLGDDARHPTLCTRCTAVVGWGTRG